MPDIPPVPRPRGTLARQSQDRGTARARREALDSIETVFDGLKAFYEHISGIREVPAEVFYTLGSVTGQVDAIRKAMRDLVRNTDSVLPRKPAEDANADPASEP